LAPTSASRDSDTTIAGGVLDVARFTVAQGVTVTVNGALTVNTTGPIEIAGNLRGACHAMAFNAGGLLTVSGSLDNSCADAPEDPPTLQLVGLGGYDLGGAAVITTSGDFEVTNDPTLTDADFPPPLAGSAGQPIALRSFNRAIGATARVDDCKSGATIEHKPERARSGDPGTPQGGPGRRGSRLFVSCRGAAVLDNQKVLGQHGGHGG
jgi:hypothetical protein